MRIFHFRWGGDSFGWAVTSGQIKKIGSARPRNGPTRWLVKDAESTQAFVGNFGVKYSAQLSNEAK